MSDGLKRVLINGAVILGGGWLLSSMNFMPWFAVGVPLLVVLSMPQLAPKPKPSTFLERHPNLTPDPSRAV